MTTSAPPAEFVKLNDDLRNADGIQVDMTSGWGISGEDVRRWPDHPAAQEWARVNLRRGLLEAATQEEWDEVHEDDDPDDRDVVLTKDDDKAPRSESAVRYKSEQRRAARLEKRANGGSSGENVEDDYTDMSKDDLKAEAESRGLPTSGTRADLQARLREDDESGD